MKTEQRVIKYRAWDDCRKKMIYHFHERSWRPDKYRILFTEEDCMFCGNYQDNGDWNEPILMQFTGLVDKEGVEIYEGDIVECYDHPTNVDSTTGPVEFQHGYYNVNGHALHDYGTAWTKVIGNIYQHPHLLPSTTTI